MPLSSSNMGSGTSTTTYTAACSEDALVEYAALYAACGLSEEVTGASCKTKPCTKFFSTSGCPYGESCHFLHFVAGGIAALGMQVPKQLQGGGGGGGGGNILLAPANVNDPSVTVNGYKTRLCNRFNTPEGCRFADNCHFAHGDADLRRPLSKVAPPPPPHSTPGALLYHPASSYNLHALLQSADAAYNTVQSSACNLMSSSTALDATNYTYGAPLIPSCSFNYVSTSNASVTTPAHTPYVSQIVATTTSSSSSTHHVCAAEPTPPGVSVPPASASCCSTTTAPLAA